MFCSAKEFIPTDQKSNVIYCLTCPGCNKKYIGKTDPNLITGLNEQGSRDDKPMYQHLLKYGHYNDIVKLRKLPDNDSATAADKNELILNDVLTSLRIVVSCSTRFL